MCREGTGGGEGCKEGGRGKRKGREIIVPIKATGLSFLRKIFTHYNNCIYDPLAKLCSSNDVMYNMF